MLLNPCRNSANIEIVYLALRAPHTEVESRLLLFGLTYNPEAAGKAVKPCAFASNVYVARWP